MPRRMYMWVCPINTIILGCSGSLNLPSHLNLLPAPWVKCNTTTQIAQWGMYNQIREGGVGISLFCSLLLLCYQSSKNVNKRLPRKGTGDGTASHERFESQSRLLFRPAGETGKKSKLSYGSARYTWLYEVTRILWNNLSLIPCTRE